MSSVTQLVGRHRTKRKVAGLIPGLGTYLDYRFGPSPHLEQVQEATNQCFSPSHSPSLPFSLKINK